jgi:hypothetical protein
MIVEIRIIFARVHVTFKMLHQHTALIHQMLSLIALAVRHRCQLFCLNQERTALLQFPIVRRNAKSYSLAVISANRCVMMANAGLVFRKSKLLVAVDGPHRTLSATRELKNLPAVLESTDQLSIVEDTSVVSAAALERRKLVNDKRLNASTALPR